MLCPYAHQGRNRIAFGHFSFSIFHHTFQGHPLHARGECRSNGLKHHTPKLVLGAFHTWRLASTPCQGQQHQTHTHTRICTYIYIHIYIHILTCIYIYTYRYNMVAYYMCFLKIQTLIIINYVGIYKAARLVLGQYSIIWSDKRSCFFPNTSTLTPGLHSKSCLQC